MWHQRHQHLLLCWISGNPKGPKNHIRQNCVRLQTTQSGERTIQADGWKWKAGLIWRSRHFHCGHHYINNFDQHHSINKGSRNDDDGHLKLLLVHPDTYIWVHSTTYSNNTRQNHQNIWPERKDSRRLGILGNMERYVWNKTGRSFSKWIVITKTGPFWLLPTQTYRGTIDTQNTANIIHTSCGWLCSKVHGNREFPSPAQRPTT